MHVDCTFGKLQTQGPKSYSAGCISARYGDRSCVSSYYACPEKDMLTRESTDDGTHMFKKVRPQARKVGVKRLLPAVALGLEPIRHRHLCEMQPCGVRQNYASKA